MLFFRKKYSIALSIPEPCAQAWSGMQPDGHGRHCAHCQKTVIDFTGMTDTEVLAYFKHSGGTTCGRFYEDQLDRSMQEAARPKQRWWLRIAAGVVLALGLSKESRAQERAAKYRVFWAVNDPENKDEPAPEAPPANLDSILIKGTLVDSKNNPLISGTVTVLQGGIAIGSMVTDFDGNYELPLVQSSLNGSSIEVKFLYQGSIASYRRLITKRIVIINGRLSLSTITIMGGLIRTTYQPPLLQPKGRYQVHCPDRR